MLGSVGVPAAGWLLGNIRGALAGDVGRWNKASVSLSILDVFSARSLDLAECNTNAAVCSPKVRAVAGRTILAGLLGPGTPSASSRTL